MGSEPELNGSPVVVKAHNAEATEFVVRGVLSAGEETRVVKASNLEFDAPYDLFDKVPNAPTVVGKLGMANLPSDAGGAAVIDFSDGDLQ